MSLRKRAETATPEKTVAEVEKQLSQGAPEETTTEEQEALPFEGDAKAAAEEAAEAEADKAVAKQAAQELLKDSMQKQELTPKADSEVAVAKDRTTTADLFHQAGQALEEAGFGGLDHGFGAYAIVALQNEGMFEDSNNDSLGKAFTGIILESRTKWVFSNTKCEKKDEQALYSYDGTTDTNTDQPLAPTIEEWAEKGWGFERRPYTEVTVDLTDGDRAGEIVLLSLPKTSRTKFTGYISTNARRFKLYPSQYVTKFEVGDKITSTPFPFFPWKFSFDKELPVVEG